MHEIQKYEGMKYVVLISQKEKVSELLARFWLIVGLEILQLLDYDYLGCQ